MPWPKIWSCGRTTSTRILDFRYETEPFTIVLDRKWLGTLSEWQERERKHRAPDPIAAAPEVSSVRYTDRGIPDGADGATATHRHGDRVLMTKRGATLPARRV